MYQRFITYTSSGSLWQPLKTLLDKDTGSEAWDGFLRAETPAATSINLTGASCTQSNSSPNGSLSSAGLIRLPRRGIGGKQLTQHPGDDKVRFASDLRPFGTTLFLGGYDYNIIAKSDKPTVTFNLDLWEESSVDFKRESRDGILKSVYTLANDYFYQVHFKDIFKSGNIQPISSYNTFVIADLMCSDFLDVENADSRLILNLGKDVDNFTTRIYIQPYWGIAEVWIYNPNNLDDYYSLWISLSGLDFTKPLNLVITIGPNKGRAYSNGILCPVDPGTEYIPAYENPYHNDQILSISNNISNDPYSEISFSLLSVIPTEINESRAIELSKNPWSLLEHRSAFNLDTSSIRSLSSYSNYQESNSGTGNITQGQFGFIDSSTSQVNRSCLDSFIRKASKSNTGILRLDTSNPFSDNVAFAFPGLGSPIIGIPSELGVSVRRLQDDASLNLVPTKYGIAHNATGNEDGLAFLSSKEEDFPNVPSTLSITLTPTSAIRTTGIYHSVLSGTFGMYSPSMPFHLSILNYNGGRVVFRPGGTNGADITGALFDGVGNFNIGEERSIGIIAKGGIQSTTMSDFIVVNDKKPGAVSNTGTQALNAYAYGGLLYIGDWSGRYPDCGFPGIVHSVVYWLKPLSAGDLADFHKNPRQVFTSGPNYTYRIAKTPWAIEVISTGIDLVADTTTQSNSSNTAAISQINIPSAATTSQGNISSTTTINQVISTLAGSASTQSNVASTSVATIIHNTIASTTVQANVASVTVITQTHILIGTTSIIANSSGTAVITQSHVLAGASSTEANTGGTAVITQVHSTLAGSNCNQANNTGTAVLTEIHIVVGSPTSQANTSDTDVITQVQVVTSATSVQVNNTSTGVVVSLIDLTGGDTNQTAISGNSTVSIATLIIPRLRDWTIPPRGTFEINREHELAKEIKGIILPDNFLYNLKDYSRNGIVDTGVPPYRRGDSISFRPTSSTVGGGIQLTTSLKRETDVNASVTIFSRFKRLSNPADITLAYNRYFGATYGQMGLTYYNVPNTWLVENGNGNGSENNNIALPAPLNVTQSIVTRKIATSGAGRAWLNGVEYTALSGYTSVIRDQTAYWAIGYRLVAGVTDKFVNFDLDAFYVYDDRPWATVHSEELYRNPYQIFQRLKNRTYSFTETLTGADVITIASDFVGSDSTQVNNSEADLITQNHLVLATAASQANSCNTGIISITGDIDTVAATTTQSNSSSSNTITQIHNLDILDTLILSKKFNNWTKQPPKGTGLNNDNSFAKELSWLVSGNDFIDLVSGDKVGSPLASQYSHLSLNDTIALSNTTTNYYELLHTEKRKSIGALTLFMLVNRPYINAGGSLTKCHQNGANFNEFDFQLSNGQFYFVRAGSSNYTAGFSTDNLIPTTGKIFCAVTCADGDIANYTNWKFYANNLSSTFSVTNPSTGTVASNSKPIRFNRRDDTFSSTESNFILAGAINRELKPAEMAALIKNPWQLIGKKSTSFLKGIPNYNITLQNQTSSTGIIDLNSEITLTAATTTQNNNTSTASIEQLHNVVSSNSTEANNTSTNSISQIHLGLSGSACTQAQTSSTSAIIEAHNVVSTTSTQINLSSTNTIVQIHLILGVNTSQANNTSTNTITQNHILVGANASQANLSEYDVITAVHYTNGSPSSQSNNSSALTVTQNHNTTSSTISIANNSSAQSISQIHILVGATSTEVNNSSINAIILAQTLVGANVSQANYSNIAAIIEEHNVVAAPCSEANSSSSDSITQTHILVGSNSSEGNTSGTGTIGSSGYFLAANTTQSNNSSTNIITQVQIVVGSASVESNNSSTNVITQIQLLVAGNSTQSNSSSTNIITQTHLGLTGSSSNQSNNSEYDVITLVQNTSGAPASQSNVSSTNTITQIQILVVSNTTQANLSGTGSIGSSVYVTGATSSQANISSTIPITQIHKPLTSASNQANNTSTHSITSIHHFNPDPSVQINIFSTGAVVETIVLVGDTTIQSNNTNTNSITQIRNLVGITNTQSNSSSTNSIILEYNFNINNSTQINNSSVGYITTSGYLIGTDCLQSNSCNTGIAEIIVNINVVGNTTTQSNNTDTQIIEQIFVLHATTCIQTNLSKSWFIVQITTSKESSTIYEILIYDYNEILVDFSTYNISITEYYPITFNDVGNIIYVNEYDIIYLNIVAPVQTLVGANSVQSSYSNTANI